MEELLELLANVEKVLNPLQSQAEERMLATVERQGNRRRRDERLHCTGALRQTDGN